MPRPAAAATAGPSQAARQQQALSCIPGRDLVPGCLQPRTPDFPWMTPQSLVVFKSCFKPGIPLTARWASHTASISLENHLFQSWGPVTGAEMGNEALKPSLKSTFSHIVAQATEHLTHLQPGHVWQGNGVLQTSTPSDPLGPDWEPGTTEEGRLGSNCDQSKAKQPCRARALG